MQSTNFLVIIGLISTLLISGCATKPEKESTIGWTGDATESDASEKVDEDTKTDKPSAISRFFGFDAEEPAKKTLASDQEEGEKSGQAIAGDMLEISTEGKTTDTAQPDTEAPAEAQPGTPKPTQITTTPTTTPPTTPGDEIAAPIIVEAIIKPIIPKQKSLAAHSPEHEAQATAALDEYKIALADMKSGNLDSALQLFVSLSSEYPLLSGPIVNQGIILRKQGKLKEARKLLQNALYSKFKNPSLLNELGVINRDLGHFKQAKQSYLSAIRIDNAYPTAHFNLGVLADLYLHDPELALQEFEVYQSFQEKPGKKVSGWIKEIKRRIKRAKKAAS